MRRSILLTLALSLTSLGGCRDRGADGAAADDDEGGSEGGSGDADGGDDDGDPASCDALPPRVGLQRLTRAEYNRTVRDLFGVTSAPATAFPPDSSTEGFDNIAGSLTISPQLAALLLDAAQTVADDAIAGDDGTILSCTPATDAGCIDTILRDTATRVYRRPPSAAELAGLHALVAQAQDEGEPFDATIAYAISGMLMAPQFLYRGVPPEGAAPLGEGERASLDDYAIASRLSYMLWGSTPDDALLAAAAAGELSDADGLRTQFDRLLADDKAYALYDGFFSQWLQLGKLGQASPDPAAYPSFDEALRDAMAAETREFFSDLRARDGSPMEILTSTTTFANADLAAIYGLDGITGEALVEVELDPDQRAGVLTMPAVLAMTSNPDRTNVVKRGVWVAESLLCAAPPPPPPDVPAEPPPEPGETERDRLARHRADPNCASCHDLIDPLGFPFEGYDILGARREEAYGQPLDDLGELPDGTRFHGVIELSELLAEREEYRACVTRKLMTYTLGRIVTPSDQCAVDEIAGAHVTDDASLSDLLWAVVTSDAFSTEGGQ